MKWYHYLVVTAGLAIISPFVIAQEATKDSPVEHAEHADVELPKHAIVLMVPTQGNEVTGVLKLEATGEGLKVTGEVTGLSPGEHGFHIHQFGDLTSADGKAAGGHYASSPTHSHGELNAEGSHEGDLGNITADNNGTAQVDVVSKHAKLHFVLGRSIVIHAGKDDLKSQPSGDSGDRVAVGVIGLAAE